MTHTYLNILGELLKVDFKIFRRTIVDKLIDLFIWVTTMEWVFACLMPSFGLENAYTEFMVASLTASGALFETFPAMMTLMNDRDNGLMKFYVSLPIPAWVVFIRYFLFFVFNAMVMTAWILPISQLFFLGALDLTQFCWSKFLFAFVFGSGFYSAFAVWLGSWATMQRIGNVFMRYIYPLWFLGGFQFSWNVLHQFNPQLAYIDLLNPMLHLMEAYRGAILGPEGALNFWSALGAVVLLSSLLLARAMQQFKKKMDLV